MRKPMIKRGLICLCLLLFGGPGRAATPPSEQRTYVEQQYHVVRDLRYDWQVFDRTYGAYVPYLKPKHGNVSSVSLAVDLAAQRGNELLFYAAEETYLFVNAALQRRIEPGWVILRTDSLRAFYRQGPFFLTLYCASGTLPPPTALIGHRKTIRQVAASVAPVWVVQPRRVSGFNYFVVLASLFILGNYAFLRNLHAGAFARFYSPRSLFAASQREDDVQVGKPLNSINLLFLLNHAFLLALLYVLIREGTQRTLFPEPGLRTPESLGHYASHFLVVGSVVFLLIVVKYAGTYLLGNLFRFEKLVNVHFFEYIHLSKVFYTLIVPVWVVIFTSYPSHLAAAERFYIPLIIGFSFLRIGLISLSLNRLASHRNLYLFSYLCVTELVPLLTGIKVLL
ncbi:MAG: DUF4271 domain-containing protein [Ferruginibacter sp.]|nr:DUF4271 domain-containing protein [Cytophagales bacterium]